MILNDSWMSLEFILIDSWISLSPDSDWFLWILNDSWWFSPILNDSHWFSIILANSQWFWNKCGIDSHWFSNKSNTWFSLILADSQWFSNKCGIDSSHHDLYMVGKRRLSALKWYLVCENWLRIEVTGAIWNCLQL